MNWPLRVLTICALFLLIPATHGHCRPSDDNGPIETTVCSIQAKPRAYDGKAVSIAGRIRSDGVHGIGIDDLKCPDKIVDLFLPRPGSDADGIKALLHAVYSGEPGTIDKDISARVIGKVKFTVEGRPPIVLHVSQVQDVKMAMKTTK